MECGFYSPLKSLSKMMFLISTKGYPVNQCTIKHEVNEKSATGIQVR